MEFVSSQRTDDREDASDRLKVLKLNKYSRSAVISNFLFNLMGLTILFATGFVAVWLFGLDARINAEQWRSVIRSLLFGVFFFSSRSPLTIWRDHALSKSLLLMAGAWLLLFSSMACYAWLIDDFEASGLKWWVAWACLSFVSMLILKVIDQKIQNWLSGKRGVVRAAILGEQFQCEQVVRHLKKNAKLGIIPGGCFSLDEDGSQAGCDNGLDSLFSQIDAHLVDEVWLALSRDKQNQIDEVLKKLCHYSIDIKLVPDLNGLHLVNHSVEEVAGLPIINIQQTPHRGTARLVKAIEDRLLAALILLAISPLMIVIAIAVKISSPGPIFYRQERMSWNNKTFWMLKFRSMPIDAESSTGAVWAKAGENRATKIGSFLRKTSLDELPQFINVLKGDMSIVGPRPERPVFVHKFKHEIPAYMKKHMVKAGITGWAQVNGWRGSTDLGKRIECDLYYIQNWSIIFDLKIIFLTLFKGFVNKNAY